MQQKPLIPVIALTDAARVEAVRERLRTTLAPDTRELTGGCRSCGIPAPTLGSRFRVTTYIQTCHLTSGLGLDQPHYNSLPPGEYRVMGTDQHQGDGHSHWLKLERVSDGAKVEMCYGYTRGHCMDWRSIERVSLPQAA
jgi:hypothetical protein